MERNSRFDMGSRLHILLRISACVDTPKSTPPNDSLSVSFAVPSISLSGTDGRSIVGVRGEMNAATSMRRFKQLAVTLKLLNSTGVGLWKCAEMRGSIRWSGCVEEF